MAQGEQQPSDDFSHEASKAREAAALSKKKEADDKTIKLAQARLRICETAEQEFKDLSVEDISFSMGNQWSARDRQERKDDGRPCLTINKMPQLVQQVTNDQRQNRPAIKVHPVGDGANQDTADALSGIVRHIEYISNADAAYDTAFDLTVRGGYGYWRVATGYVRPDTFDQELYIRRIKDHLSVHLDPNCKEADGSDAEYGFIGEWMLRADYEDAFPQSMVASADGWSSAKSFAPAWMRDGAVLVTEYFFKEYHDQKIHLMTSGKTVKEQDLQKYMADSMKAQQMAEKVAQVGGEPAPQQEPEQVIKTRVARVPKVVHLKMNGIEILERTTFPGSFIPIVPVYGQDIYLEGKRTLEGLVRHAKDPQRMYNFCKSAQSETIGLAPRAPYIGAKGAFEGFEELWKTANRKNHPFLEYNPKSYAGELAPPPQRQNFEPAINAITESAAGWNEDLKATTGMWDATMGRRQGDESGVAIQRLTTQSQTGNFHLTDNLARALKFTGRILISAIPVVYDSEDRLQRIIKEDGTQKLIRLNVDHTDDDGKKVFFDLDQGIYDCTVDTGPSYASKRQEAASSIMGMAKVWPPMMERAGDLLLSQMDWPMAREVSERLRPPGMSDNKQIPPAVQKKMADMSQMIEQLTAKAHELAQIVEMKTVETSSKERIALFQAQVDLEKTLATLGSNSDIEVLRHEIGLIHKRLDQAHQTSLADKASQDKAAAAAAQPEPTGGASPG